MLKNSENKKFAFHSLRADIFFPVMGEYLRYYFLYTCVEYHSATFDYNFQQFPRIIISDFSGNHFLGVNTEQFMSVHCFEGFGRSGLLFPVDHRNFRPEEVSRVQKCLFGVNKINYLSR